MCPLEIQSVLTKIEVEKAVALAASLKGARESIPHWFMWGTNVSVSWRGADFLYKFPI